MSDKARLHDNAWRHLRWVFNRLLLTVKCHFCEQPVFTAMLSGKEWYGIQKLVTIHHIDGDHHNDAPNNLAPCHVSCHRAYHGDRTFKSQAGGERVNKGLIKAHTEAFRKGDEAEAKRLADEIDKNQQNCPHPPDRVVQTKARTANQKRGIAVGDTIHLCTRCQGLAK